MGFPPTMPVARAPLTRGVGVNPLLHHRPSGSGEFSHALKRQHTPPLTQLGEDRQTPESLSEISEWIRWGEAHPP